MTKTTELHDRRGHSRPVWAEQLTAGVLVRAVAALLDAVAEELLLDAGGVAAGQLSGHRADGLVGHQQRLGLHLARRLVAVEHVVLPVTCLLLDVENQALGTLDLLQTL